METSKWQQKEELGFTMRKKLKAEKKLHSRGIKRSIRICSILSLIHQTKLLDQASRSNISVYKCHITLPGRSVATCSLLTDPRYALWVGSALPIAHQQYASPCLLPTT